MSELTPSIQADDIRTGLLDYLTTTFALTDDDARSSLLDFLTDPDDGIFKGPYLRTRLPFRPADDGWRSSLDWYQGPTPYGHQAAAFARLTSADVGVEKPRPLPTLVTTGTGSGKTEAFLCPIIDHVLRAKRQGVGGTKALILYPMNALANDQAQRLAALLSSHDELSGVTAALYTGQDGPKRTKVSAAGLITDRAVIRSSAPDILLTNYKMLDQMLLRHHDAKIWQQSARSLQYLVLDEFHTYDGAQGTDVSMLLRRLGLTLKSYWSREDPALTDEDWSRPLGQLTPVATSATLGDRGDPAAMLEFAQTVFGDEDFTEEAVVTEARLTVDEWISDAPERMRDAGYIFRDGTDMVERVAYAADQFKGTLDGEAATDLVLTALTDGPSAADIGRFSLDAKIDVLKGHPFTARLLARTGDAHLVSDLHAALTPAGTAVVVGEERADAFLLTWVAALSHLRALAGRQAPSIDLHLWVRELTRIDRVATVSPQYRWFDDGDVQTVNEVEGEEGQAFPALYCRHCGRSGWGVTLAPTGSDLDTNDTNIRGRHLVGDDRFRALIFAPSEGEAFDTAAEDELVNLRWLDVFGRRLHSTNPTDEAAVRAGQILPILTHVGDDAGKESRDDTCPSCQQRDGIRFLGSAIATMLSVALSILFGSDGLDGSEKKALVFTDSVQDAAHRAGFVQSRSHSLTLRAVMREALSDQPASLDALVDRMLAQAGDDPHRRYRLLPSDFADREEFTPFFTTATLAKVPSKVRTRVKKRLLFDAVMEFGLASRLGRTLEVTGSVAARVDVPALTLSTLAKLTIDEAGGQPFASVAPPDERARIAWVRGVLERMRERGAVEHEWFQRYQQEDGSRFSIWTGRPRSQGMPAFPKGRPAPAYPRIGGSKLAKETDLDPVASPQSWYALWTTRVLQVSRQDGAVLSRLLMQRLAKADVLKVTNSNSAAQVFQIAQSSILIEPVALTDLEAGHHLLTCPVCGSRVPAAPVVTAQLDGAPCMVVRCLGKLQRTPGKDNFYRQLYSASDIRRVVAREHTSLLDDKTRLAYEDGFKGQQDDPQAPNVLVATPTLEMGIDIGDLSTVILASLPRSVASYLQRVGRAGRLTGNALNLAFVTGRGEQLPRLGDPLSVINGQVRPPATYLDAEEILKRQYVASVADRLARSPDMPHPEKASQAIGSIESGSYLRTVIAEAESVGRTYLDRFLDSLPTVTKEAREHLTRWTDPVEGKDGTSPLSVRLHEEVHRWVHTVQTLEFRIKVIEGSIPELEQRAESPAKTEDDAVALRTARAALRLTRAQVADLRGKYWISVLEEFGIFPNYTLIDDSVTLDVALSWIDPDTSDYQSEPWSFKRGASLALRELAPGATFYASGHKIRIDAVDLGHDGEAVRTWAFCPACGYGHDLGASPALAACPRCGAVGISDVNQQLDVVELERVSAAMRREEAIIDDGRDERTRERFTMITAADIDQVDRQWFVDGYGFGVKHLRDMTIRWLNLGSTHGRGSTRIIAGEDTTAPLFRVCSSCGQLDTSTHSNRTTEHRPWCPHRKSTEESTRQLALSRTLTTEGLVIRLPPDVVVGDGFALPSLASALLLGLREHIGGAPDHIAIESIMDPSLAEGGDTHEALLLHDVVPGGTGYLADLADPETFRSVLWGAWRIARDCPCEDEGRLACHRCLLPFAGSRPALVSRVSAERHLRNILMSGHSDDEPDERSGWSLVEVENQHYDPETHIEQRFRKVLTERLELMGATLKQVPGPKGNRIRITLGGGRRWSLEPQETVLGAQPDFMLRSDDPNVPNVAIFCDGWKFHASPAINRLADDADKREVLRLAGYVVIALTWQDLQDATKAGPKTDVPAWLDESSVGPVMSTSGGALNQSTVDFLRSNPIDLLVRWIQAPEPAALRKLADLLPLFLVRKAQSRGKVDPATGLDVAGLDLLGTGGLAQTGEASAWAWRHDSFVVVSRAVVGSVSTDTEVALVIDDRTESLGLDHRAAWRSWLRISNLLNLRTRSARITTRSRVGSAAAPVLVASSDVATALPAEWVDLYTDASPVERVLIQALAAHGVSRPVLGHESAEGIPLTLAWPDQHVTVSIDLEESDRPDLAAEGWTIVEADADAISAALTAAEGKI